MSRVERTSGDRGEELPVDERLIMPETRYEVLDGEVMEVAPCDQPHGSRHSKLSALLEAYAGDEHDAACDMLTRTSELNDFAPDGSIYPIAPHPQTGGRQLEELAFEVVSTETLAHAGRKAAHLIARGVRRVFAIDVQRKRGLEWSAATGAWEILATDARIEDAALVAPLPVFDLVGAAKTDDAVARALLAKKNHIIAAALAETRAEGLADGRLEGKAEGKAEAVLAVLAARGLSVDDATRATILAERDPRTLDAWVAGAVSCDDARALLALRS